MKFAKDTIVPVERTRAEIEATVNKYGATSFISGWQLDKAVVSLNADYARFYSIDPPTIETLAAAKGYIECFPIFLSGIDSLCINPPSARQLITLLVGTHTAAAKLLDKARAHGLDPAVSESARIWRALLLAIKAKLEAVECGISEFDSEFMANIVLPTGMTMYETLRPDMPAIVSHGRLPPLLPSPSEVIEATVS